MFLFQRPTEWIALANALGLTPYEATAGYGHGTSFRQLKRALGVVATRDPSFSYWLYGRYRGHEVMVLTYDVGSGSNRTTYTGVLARIDPPLFLGLSVRSSGFADKLFGGPDIRLGQPFVDDKLRIEGFDPARISTLLSLQDPDGWAVVHAILRSEPTRLNVSDSVVTYSTHGTITDVARIQRDLEMATSLATMLAARRKAVPESEGERAQRAVWQRFADAYAFTFDPERMTLSGSPQGTEIKIALESEGQLLRTAVNVRFPQMVNVAFTARRTSMPSFLQGLFHQDIQVGFGPFDDMFLVTGYPEPAVREIVARPELLQVLVHLGGRTTEVQMNHAQLFFRFKGPSPTEHELQHIVEVAQRASSALFGQVKQVQPYR